MIRFETARLTVAGWEELQPEREARVADVMAILTPATTRHLPPDWHGTFDVARAERWLDERDETVLLAIETASGRSVGLVILAEAVDDDLQLGYVLAQRFWGRGLATELVAGLVRNMDQPLNAGVTADNPASIRVLERAGFVASGTTPSGDLRYRRASG